MVRSLANKYKDAFSGLPSGIWALAFVLFVHRSGTMVLPFLSLHLKDHVGLSAAHAALLLSLFGLGSVLGSLLGGRLTQRFGAIRVMVSMLLATAPLYLVLLAANSVPMVAVAIFMLSLIGDTVRPAAMTATADLCAPHEMSRAFALIRLAINLGMSIGPAAAGFLYREHFSWIFVIDAVSCVLAAGLVALLFGWVRDPVVNAATPPSQPLSGPSCWQDLGFLAVLSLFGLTMIVFLQTLTVYPIYLREQCGLSEAAIGLLFSINTVLIVVCEMVLIASVDRFRRLPIIGLGCVLICLGFGALPLSHATVFVAATVVVWTMGEMLSMPLLTTWIGERAPVGRRGEYMGASTAMFSVSWVLAPLFGGAMYALHPNAVWIASLGLAILVGGGFAYLGRRLEASQGQLPPADAARDALPVKAVTDARQDSPCRPGAFGESGEPCCAQPSTPACENS